jgi:hypothetical protein
MPNAKRESQKEFWARMEREERREEAEWYLEELLEPGPEPGLTKREAQEYLVEEFQPLDGTKTRAWLTPDPWECGRLDGKKPPPDSKEQLELDIQWAHDNPGLSPDMAPTPGAKLLLKVAQERPADFLKLYVNSVPAIARRQEEELNDRQSKVHERREAAKRQEAARQRAIAEEEARRKQEAEKRENERLERNRKQKQRRLERKQAAAPKPSTNGQRQNSAIPMGEDEWGTI